MWDSQRYHVNWILVFYHNSFFWIAVDKKCFEFPIWNKINLLCLYFCYRGYEVANLYLQFCINITFSFVLDCSGILIKTGRWIILLLQIFIFNSNMLYLSLLFQKDRFPIDRFHSKSHRSHSKTNVLKR